MTYGEARRSISDRIYKFPDGGTILGSQLVVEAERAIAEADSAALVDEAYRFANDLAEKHRLLYGFDRPDLMSDLP